MAMRPFAPLALVFAALVGCGVPPPPAAVANADDKAATDSQTTKSTPAEPNKAPGKTTKPEPVEPATTVKEDPAKQGLIIVDKKVGTGAVAEPGDTCYMLYTGKLKSNGKVFDSSEKHGNKPFSFPLGAGQVIKGWDLGVKGMKVGGERTLEIPSELGYGASGQGDDIPGNSTLIFDIKLLDVLKANDNTVVDRKTVTPGTGPAVKKGDVVSIKYRGTLIDGTEFDSNMKPGGKPFQFKVGTGEVIPGFDIAVTGMKKGETVKVKIPPALGYGPREQGTIPANSVLNFEITVVSID